MVVTNGPTVERTDEEFATKLPSSLCSYHAVQFFGVSFLFRLVLLQLILVLLDHVKLGYNFGDWIGLALDRFLLPF